MNCFLTHFNQKFYLYTSWKQQKPKGYLMFPGSIEMEHWAKMG